MDSHGSFLTLPSLQHPSPLPLSHWERGWGEGRVRKCGWESRNGRRYMNTCIYLCRTCQVALQIAGRDGGEEDPAFKPAFLVEQDDPVVRSQAEPRGIRRIHQHRVAVGPGQGIGRGIDQGIELFTTAGADLEFAVAPADGGNGNWPQARLAIGGGKLPIGAQMRPTVLELVAALV